MSFLRGDPSKAVNAFIRQRTKEMHDARKTDKGRKIVQPPDLARLAVALKQSVVGRAEDDVITEELAKLAAYLADLEARLKVHDYANMRFV